jgi:hypothetical protein
LLLVAACAGTAPDRAADGAAQPAAPDPAQAPLAPDLLPFSERTAVFQVVGGRTTTLRVEPEGDRAANLLLDDGEGGKRRLRALREGASVFVSGGPSRGTELLRLGAAPGTGWTSGETAVRFEGWERVEVPGGSFDAARIVTRTGPEQLQRIETWWFAPGEGIVRLRSDHGGIFAEELVLSARP